jgi:hypothetical protein
LPVARLAGGREAFATDARLLAEPLLAEPLLAGVPLLAGARLAGALLAGALLAGAFRTGADREFPILDGNLALLERLRGLPPTDTEPDPGTRVDSSPVDHLTLRSVPLTPVTTPSRGGWPSFRDATWTRSPTVAISTSIDIALAESILSSSDDEKKVKGPVLQTGPRADDL